MDSHEQKSNHPSTGHEEHQHVHYCHKCGWPFPNPHPSSKHRRAHRRICGTIEGYKIEEIHHELNASDGESSDDDYKTPSAKAFEQSENEKGSASIDEKSNRSEDEVFSDAAVNFMHDESPKITAVGSEEVPQSEGTLLQLEEDIPTHVNYSTDRAEKECPVVPENIVDSPERMNAQHHFAKFPVDTLVDCTRESSALPAGSENGVNDDPDIIKPGPSTSLLTEAKKPDGDMLQSASQHTKLKVVEEDNPLSHDNTCGSPESFLKSEETCHATPIPMPKVDVKVVGESAPLSPGNGQYHDAGEVNAKLGETCKSVAVLEPQTEPSTEERASNQVSIFGDSPQVELDIHQKLGVSTSADDVRETKAEEDDKFIVFAVPHGVPKLENIEGIVKGFKDHNKMGWFLPDKFGLSERILEDNIVVASPADSQQEATNEVSEIPSDLHDSKDMFELAVKNKPAVEGFTWGTLIADHQNKELTDLRAFTSDTVEEDSNIKKDTKEFVVENLKVSEPADNALEMQTNLGGDLIRGDGIPGHEKLEKGKAGVAEKDAIESARNVQEPHRPNKKPDGNAENVMLTQDAVPLSHGNLENREMNEKDKTMQSTSEDHIVVEDSVVPSDATSLVEASAPMHVNGDEDPCLPRSDHLLREGDINLVKPPLGAPNLGASVDSRSTDSLDANWGSVSVLSTQSDTPAAVEDSKAAFEAGRSTTNAPRLETEVSKNTETLEVFESPSFMTLVEPMEKGEKTTSSTNQGQPVWFPSLAKVSNDSKGRKKNEEIIAKVTNWSSNQQQHSPLKSLLVEANRDAKPKPPHPRESTPDVAEKQENVTVSSILGSKFEKANENATAQEWNSPAHPTKIKREKRKAKGRSYWHQFMCCSSVD